MSKADDEKLAEINRILNSGEHEKNISELLAWQQAKIAEGERRLAKHERLDGYMQAALCSPHVPVNERFKSGDLGGTEALWLFIQELMVPRHGVRTVKSESLLLPDLRRTMAPDYGTGNVEAIYREKHQNEWGLSLPGCLGAGAHNESSDPRAFGRHPCGGNHRGGGWNHDIGRQNAHAKSRGWGRYLVAPTSPTNQHQRRRR